MHIPKWAAVLIIVICIIWGWTAPHSFGSFVGAIGDGISYTFNAAESALKSMPGKR